ncbi:MAG: T9SS type A sorting domain-containing protein [Aquaticitalea sp.]
MKRKTVFRIVFLLLITNLSAQNLCQDQLELNNVATGFKIGQSIFMPDCTGVFSSIELSRTDDGPEIVAEFEIYTGQTFIGTPRYTQTVTIPQASGPFTVNFENGEGTLAFFEDSQYTFILSNPNLQLDSSSDIDSYLNGQMFVEVGFINNDDLWFKLNISTTLGIENHELTKKTLVPNPSTDYFQISGLFEHQQIAIYNVLGAKVKSGFISQNEKVDVRNLSNGLYFLKLNDGNTLKFYKK